MAIRNCMIACYVPRILSVTRLNVVLGAGEEVIRALSEVEGV
jgi:hypothetical protein